MCRRCCLEAVGGGVQGIDKSALSNYVLVKWLPLELDAKCIIFGLGINLARRMSEREERERSSIYQNVLNWQNGVFKPEQKQTNNAA